MTTKPKRVGIRAAYLDYVNNPNSVEPLTAEEIAAIRVQLTLRAADLWGKQLTNPTADKAEAIALCERLIAKLAP